MKFSSNLINEAVEALALLPGIGKRTALRLVLHLIRQEPDITNRIADALKLMRSDIKECKHCHNISDQEVCNICLDARRDASVICVVENIRDVLAIEETGQFRGLYHVLGGVISPIEGIGPETLHIDSLMHRVQQLGTKELVMAISPTIEGETTIFYITKKMRDIPVQISTIARGVSFGSELEYADEVTLGRSILARIPYRMMEE